jgi:hypothetical protein
LMEGGVIEPHRGQKMQHVEMVAARPIDFQVVGGIQVAVEFKTLGDCYAVRSNVLAAACEASSSRRAGEGRLETTVEANTRGEESEELYPALPTKRVRRAFARLTKTYHGSRITGRPCRCQIPYRFVLLNC